MKKLALAVIFIAPIFIVGCATKEKLVSTNPDLLRIGTKPEGYPKNYIEKYSGYCIDVTETWREDHYKGQTIWFKDMHRQTVDCPAS